MALACFFRKPKADMSTHIPLLRAPFRQDPLPASAQSMIQMKSVKPHRHCILTLTPTPTLMLLALQFGLLFGLAAPSLPALAEEPLTCHPLSTANGALPEVCTPSTYREELYSYISFGEIFRHAGARWIDRIELSPDLAEGQVVYGRGRRTLRLNAFLRVRDAKDFVDSLRPRLNLIRASSDTGKKLTALIDREVETPLNTRISLKRFLDAPFGALNLTEDPTELTQEKPQEMAQEIVIGAPQTERVSATAKRSGKHGGTSAQKAALLEKKKAAVAELEGLKEAINELKELKKRGNQHPTNLSAELAGHRKKGQSLAQLADQISDSDCDRCEEAVAFCEKGGQLPRVDAGQGSGSASGPVSGSIAGQAGATDIVDQIMKQGDGPVAGLEPKLQTKTLPNTLPETLPETVKDSCRRIITFKTCYQSIPPRLLLPVENCRGTNPQVLLKRLQGKEALATSNLKEITSTLEKLTQ